MSARRDLSAIPDPRPVATWRRFLTSASYLRPAQAAHLLLKRVLLRPFPRRLPALRDPIPLREGWSPRAAYLDDPAGISFDPDARTIRLIGLDATLADPVDWVAADRPLLWRQELAYFHWLPADISWRAARPWIVDWLDHAPRDPRSIAWSPFAAAQRLIRWTRQLRGRWLAEGAGDPMIDRFLREIDLTCRYLHANQEEELLGNHLLKTAFALHAGATCFDGPDAARWLRRSTRLIRRELRAQVLGDGGHYERSPTYHLLVLVDAADALNITPDSSGLAPTLRAAVARMARVASLCRHGDGDVPLFNDSAIGQTRTPADVLDYVARVTNPREDMTRPDFVALPDFGLFRLGDARACLWLDAGETGPPFLQAHAHADTGGFELSVGATRYVVDGGVSSYQDRGRRARDRSTRAHSTVVVEGEDSSDCWGSFRVARRARIVDRAWKDAERGQSVSFSHDGFHHLAGAPTHARTVSYRGGIYSIRDRVERQGPGGLRCDALLNLGPGVVVTPGGSGWTAIHRDQPGVSLRISIEIIADDREIRLEPWVSSTGFHDERSGLRLRAACWSAGARVDIRTEISVSTG